MARKRGLISLFFGVVLLVGFFSSQVSGAIPVGTYYVATDGNDGNDGSMSHPFATISRAKTAVRSLIAGGLTADVIVYVRGGTYLFDSTLVFDAGDSGTAAHSVTYKAYPGEEVRLIGGQRLDGSWFSAVTDPTIISRLPAGAASHVMVADLAAHGITDYGTLLYRGFTNDDQVGAIELFMGTKAMTLARWPNLDPENPVSLSNLALTTSGSGTQAFYYTGSEPDRWVTAPDGWVWGYFGNSYYADSFVAIQSINASTNLITLVQAPYGTVTNGFSMYWYGFNMLEVLDAPGEWYVSRSTGKMYFYPPSDLTGADLFVSKLQTLFDIQGADYVNFEGLILEMTRWWEVKVSSASDHVRFYHCTFRNSGTDAATISGTNNGLEGCSIYDNGDGAVALHGGSRSPVTPANNYVLNSHIHNLNRWGKSYQAAVFSKKDCGLTVSHNLMHDLAGIACNCPRNNDVAITSNEIYNVCQEVDDNGALYCQWDWTARSCEIENNFIHHVQSIYPMTSGTGVQGIYLDYGASGQKITNNIIYQIGGRAIFLGGGRDNVIENNILSNCYSGIFVDRRLNYSGWSGNYTKQVDYYNSFMTGNPNWATYGPDYAGIDTILSDSPHEPMHNKVERNLATEYTTSSWLESGWLGGTSPTPVSFLEQLNNLYGKTLDVQFVDEENLNMNLQPSSPAYTIPGWQDIAFDQIGLEPEAATLYLTLDGDNYVVTGQCEPWAAIHTAVIRQTSLDVASLLTVADNGAISGIIPVTSVSSSAITVDVVTTDPKNHLSPTGSSNTLYNADLSGDGAVDTADLAMVAAHWLEVTSSPSWGGQADFNRDGVVNLIDFEILMQQWGL